MRKRLFQVIVKLVGSFTLDGMVADDGHNSLVNEFCSPSNPIFEKELSGHRVWVFPPIELIGLVLKFLLDQFKLQPHFCCCVLVPDKKSAHWYKFLAKFRPVFLFNAGTDMFRIRAGSDFERCPKVKEPWRVIGLNI